MTWAHLSPRPHGDKADSAGRGGRESRSLRSQSSPLGLSSHPKDCPGDDEGRHILSTEVSATRPWVGSDGLHLWAVPRARAWKAGLRLGRPRRGIGLALGGEGLVGLVWRVWHREGGSWGLGSPSEL